MIDVFVITKPLQYINVLNIENSNYKLLIIVDSFTNSMSFYEEVKKKTFYWQKFLYVNNMNDAFCWLIKNKSTIDKLYIDSDINHFIKFYRLRKLNISVYEEGVGTYRLKQHKARTFLGSILLFFYEVIGFKNKRGGNFFTKNIIVYFPEFYKNYHKETSKKIIGFKKPFLQHIKECNELNIFKLDVDLNQFRNKVVILYVAGWTHHKNDIHVIDKVKCDYKILKSHPHVKIDIEKKGFFDFVLKDEVPVEIIISRLIPLVKKIVLISKYSSSSIYFHNNSKIELINLDLKNKLYSDIDSYLDAYKKLAKHIK